MERNLDFCGNSFGNLNEKIGDLLLKLQDIKKTPELIDAKFLGKVENAFKLLYKRVGICGHCGGLTDDSGNCLEHFTD